ncbi:MAG: isocitrate/isopropylmalate family dehydrogenase [Armatimonadota bacterium]|nr:isocitrate/isopropylmalate family dehydrogenase [Armatimonadota bacterium]
MLPVVALHGDGIGPEILEVALAVLEAAASAAGVRLDVRRYPAGATVAATAGVPVTNEAVEACGAVGIVLKSPTGIPVRRGADGTEIGMASGYLRARLGLWANIRPVRRPPGTPAPVAGAIDCVIVRENTEGIYASRGRGIRTADVAVDLIVVTRRATDRLARLAAALALARRAARGDRPDERAARVTCVDKANVLGSFAFFREVARAAVTATPNVAFEAMHADAAAAALVQRPQAFDVMLAENLVGDILSDLAGAVAGGIGLCPSANLGHGVAMFEPIHGSAPDLAGTGRANPLGQVLSAAMLLEWAGESSAGALIEEAVDAALADGALHVEPDGTLREGPERAGLILPEFLRQRAGAPRPLRPLLLPLSSATCPLG